MNLDQIETKCFILALFIRDDGERFLLGSRAYEFVDSQLHFTANAYQNDIVEVQGNDGVMLAGQVRRGQSQAFDGYIGDSSVDRSTIEQYRQNFLKFFRKNHYYKVVYIFTDGSAIQRRQGFIVEAPEVKELYQLFPQYHISMNFEDINYYEYKEDEEGQEIYGESATLKVATAATGGLIWEDGSETTLSGEGSNFTLNGTIDGNGISNVQLKGDTTQQTYSGKNKMPMAEANMYGSSSTADRQKDFYMALPAGTYTVSFKLDKFELGTNTTLNVYMQLFDDQTAAITDFLLIDITSSTGTGRKTTTFTISRSATLDRKQNIRIPLTIWNNGGRAKLSSIQIEEGSTASEYEIYTGGSPSPNPEYPQEVQTVTGRQVVTINDGGSQSQSYEVNLGKNLLDITTWQYGYYNASGNISGTASQENVLFDYVPVAPSTIYTASSSNSIRFNFAFFDSSKTFISRDPMISGTSTSRTTTTPQNAAYMRLWVWKGGESWSQTDIDNGNFQIELGSTATTYAPYFEPIELCKIGDYQDYIYKSGDDWYVHKEIGETILGQNELASDWYTVGSSKKVFAKRTRLGTYLTSVLYIISDRFLGVARDNIGENTICLTNDGDFRIDTLDTYTKNEFLSFIEANNINAYYVLATATDTQITNTALIAQLNALAGATTYDGQTVFTVTSENQLGILSLSSLVIAGGGVVWDNYGAEWEEGTGGGPTMIDVDSIDNVYPVWELKGPAVNPQISVLTTNTTLTYTGSITASQTLSIDMFNKTATLNGTSVIGNVSGDWVYLKPGINRVTYTTNNADAPDSTIWWQEIVG